jgi:hypothetical protein
MPAGAVGCVVWAVPMYASLGSRNGLVITGACTVGLMFQHLGGGFAPSVATWLNSRWKSPWSSASAPGRLCLLSLLCLPVLPALPETRDHEFDV